MSANFCQPAFVRQLLSASSCQPGLFSLFWSNMSTFGLFLIIKDSKVFGGGIQNFHAHIMIHNQESLQFWMMRLLLLALDEPQRRCHATFQITILFMHTARLSIVSLPTLRDAQCDIYFIRMGRKYNITFNSGIWSLKVCPLLQGFSTITHVLHSQFFIKMFY